MVLHLLVAPLSIDNFDVTENDVSAEHPFRDFYIIFIYIRAKLIQNLGVTQGKYKLMSIETQTINTIHIYMYIFISIQITYQIRSLKNYFNDQSSKNIVIIFIDIEY